MKFYAVGIDPGKQTGLAIYDRSEQRIIVAETTDFWRVYNRFYASSPDMYDVFIEMPNTKHNWHKSNDNTTSVNVGMAYRESELLAEGLERLGFNVRRVSPKQKGRKLNAEQIRKITGYEGRTSQHVRDAIALCWHR